MRVIAGRFGGTRLQAVKGRQTRPTTDKIKEAMFSILMPYLNGGQVLDLYAGTGGLGIEAVSRGMDHATLVDRQRAAVAVIEQNVAKTHHEADFTILALPAKRALAELQSQGQAFDLVLFDPPYAQAKIDQDLADLVARGLLNDGAVIMVETDQEAILPASSEKFKQLQQKHYGITVLTVYQYHQAGGSQS
ncbi:16S rRNA (guanine(966)-N(2))-methyltransferase RsmD [Leuconostocaceae bacterium ESL0723]|nr:16S rRNA (guanine(966)-N(2))-methyltransferase RsmD [Leuconostocaceae bacterium ESL0723]